MDRELLHQLLDLAHALDAVPEEYIAAFASTPLCMIEEPGEVLVCLANRPHELGVVALEVLKDVIRYI